MYLDIMLLIALENVLSLSTCRAAWEECSVKTNSGRLGWVWGSNKQRG